MATKGQKRKDKDRIVLKAGESQRPNGTYDYRWTGKDGKRHAVYAKTLEELREKEAQRPYKAGAGIAAELSENPSDLQPLVSDFCGHDWNRPANW